VVEDESGIRLITKGAFDPVLDACTTIGGRGALDAALEAELRARYDEWSRAGVRVLAVAARRLPPADAYGREHEEDLDFLGFLTFLDRPKEGVSKTIADLSALGVTVKLITGDNRLVAQHLAALVGLRTDRAITGHDLLALNDEALWHAAERTDLFAEVDPNQKERIILALRKTGHVVGFLGDGVNDAPAMHASDTSLSVREAARGDALCDHDALRRGDGSGQALVLRNGRGATAMSCPRWHLRRNDVSCPRRPPDGSWEIPSRTAGSSARPCPYQGISGRCPRRGRRHTRCSIVQEGTLGRAVEADGSRVTLSGTVRS
jgi:magnesium-transporting ATPase (P-type)